MSSILTDQKRPRIWAQMRGEGGIAGSQPMSTAVHRSPNKLWRSNSIINLCCYNCHSCSRFNPYFTSMEWLSLAIFWLMLFCSSRSGLRASCRGTCCPAPLPAPRTFASCTHLSGYPNAKRPQLGCYRPLSHLSFLKAHKLLFNIYRLLTHPFPRCRSQWKTVLQNRVVYAGSRIWIFPSRIPDPDPHRRI